MAQSVTRQKGGPTLAQQPPEHPELPAPPPELGKETKPSPCTGLGKASHPHQPSAQETGNQFHLFGY